MFERGAEWRKWDLHVHTPASLFQHYKGKSADPWDHFLSELASLPREIAVLGINDYWFLDGYEKVRREHKSGNLPNILEIFPVIEVRTEIFGGVDSDLSRLNVHFICDPSLGVGTLRSQLLASLKPIYRLNEDDTLSAWSQLVTRESLADLGATVRQSVPEEIAKTLPGDLKLGFANACVPMKDARDAVELNTVLKDRVVLAVGKTEWDDFKWNTQAIASKKTLLNSASIVFTAARSREAFRKSLEFLRENRVRSKLIDCSDAHYWSDSGQKDRLGNTFTWIKADPSFRGLLHAVQEYDHRVTTEVRPIVLERLATQPRSIIDAVDVRPRADITVDVPLFDTKVVLNPGYVVVLGNKGQGKSALLDIIAAAANSDREADYSFLSKDRFRRRNGEAGYYVASIRWADRTVKSVTLSSSFDPTENIGVDYLPQSLIEHVCQADPASREKQRFETEIERVVFGHVPDDERRQSTSLRQMLADRTADSDARLVAAQTKVAQATRELIQLDDRQDALSKLGLDERLAGMLRDREAIDQGITRFEIELTALHSGDEEGVLRLQLEGERANHDALVAAREAVSGEVREANTKLRDAARLYDLVRRALADVERATADLADYTGIRSDTLVQVRLDETIMSSWMDNLERGINSRRAAISDPVEGYDVRIGVAEDQIRASEERLRERIEGAGSVLERIADLKGQRSHLLGDASDPGTELGLRALVLERDKIPESRERVMRNLRSAFGAAHAACMDAFAIKREAYSSATTFVASSELTRRVALEFDVELNAREFTASWCTFVNKNRLTDYTEMYEGGGDGLLAGVDLAAADDVFAALLAVCARLSRERGSEDGNARLLSSIARAASSAEAVLAAIFDLRWLKGEYAIRSAGRDLSELSPGQRGLVLLMFYLLVDMSDKPLLLDQPEENLDNQTVQEMLIPALRSAVGRRQVIVVTHNPNLAVVGDADQLIAASFEDGKQFLYESGSLSLPRIGKISIDVLEGTRAAFDNRESKYDHVVGHSGS